MKCKACDGLGIRIPATIKFGKDLQTMSKEKLMREVKKRLRCQECEGTGKQ